MRFKPVIPFDGGWVDVSQIVRRRSLAASADVARSFPDAVPLFRLFSAASSLRWDPPLDWPELRSWSFSRFPYRLLSTGNDDTVEVHRFLRSARDMPESHRDWPRE